jgi:7-alpha-hydroxysteroid dehydrogenase
MSFSISGKTAIVTGAANGIGLAIARQFAAKGANVMLADMDEEGLIAEIGDEADAEGSNMRYFSGDLREHLTQANLLSATIDAFDRVDILVNGSRQMLQTELFDEEDDSLSILLQQNLTCGYKLSLKVAARMKQQAEREENSEQAVGSIINLSSIAAQRTRKDLLAYSVSNAALDQMTRSLAVALASDRIRVNAVAFGSVMSASLLNAMQEDADLREEITDGTPLGRIASPAELADAAQFLASDASSFVTGHILTVDGGRSLVDNVSASAH